MKPIRYVTGDATCPAGDGPKIIVHVCNDLGKWGKGLVLAISRRWKAPELAYKAGFDAPARPTLGDVQFVPVAPSLLVANLIGQHGVATRTSRTPPVRYDAIREGLTKVATRARASGATVHMPRIGCGLAGGDWNHVEPLIADTLSAADIDVTVYDFAPS
ncbi:MAG: macro domain-containing protein [Burkholderiaceae bacterium]